MTDSNIFLSDITREIASIDFSYIPSMPVKYLNWFVSKITFGLINLNSKFEKTAVKIAEIILLRLNENENFNDFECEYLDNLLDKVIKYGDELFSDTSRLISMLSVKIQLRQNVRIPLDSLVERSFDPVLSQIRLPSPEDLEKILNEVVSFADTPFEKLNKHQKNILLKFRDILENPEEFAFDAVQRVPISLLNIIIIISKKHIRSWHSNHIVNHIFKQNRFNELNTNTQIRVLEKLFRYILYKYSDMNLSDNTTNILSLSSFSQMLKNVISKVQSEPSFEIDSVKKLNWQMKIIFYCALKDKKNLQNIIYNFNYYIDPYTNEKNIEQLHLLLKTSNFRYLEFLIESIDETSKHHLDFIYGITNKIFFYKIENDEKDNINKYIVKLPNITVQKLCYEENYMLGNNTKYYIDPESLFSYYSRLDEDIPHSHELILSRTYNGYIGRMSVREYLSDFKLTYSARHITLMSLYNTIIYLSSPQPEISPDKFIEPLKYLLSSTSNHAYKLLRLFSLDYDRNCYEDDIAHNSIDFYFDRLYKLITENKIEIPENIKIFFDRSLICTIKNIDEEVHSNPKVVTQDKNITQLFQVPFLCKNTDPNFKTLPLLFLTHYIAALDNRWLTLKLIQMTSRAKNRDPIFTMGSHHIFRYLFRIFNLNTLPPHQQDNLASLLSLEHPNQFVATHLQLNQFYNNPLYSDIIVKDSKGNAIFAHRALLYLSPDLRNKLPLEKGKEIVLDDIEMNILKGIYRVEMAGPKIRYEDTSTLFLMEETEEVAQKTSDEKIPLPADEKALYNEKLFSSLFDITLECNDGEVNAHKVILYAYSDYFKGLFRMKEGQQESIEFPTLSKYAFYTIYHNKLPEGIEDKENIEDKAYLLEMLDMISPPPAPPVCKPFGIDIPIAKSFAEDLPRLEFKKTSQIESSKNIAEIKNQDE